MLRLLRLNSDTWLIIFGGLLALLLRAMTGLHPHSGEGRPPMYGDYEAQRHWMEVTTNLPVDQWYRNTTDNDLEYWGLDYPPLTAYHMYGLGLLAERINVNYTKLHDSRGHESEAHKLFMRLSVLVVDLLMPALVVFFLSCEEKLAVPPSISIVLGLLYPGTVLIDHGHFQYNSVSLGLAVLATAALLRNRNLLASLLFCLALNYKQMELYHSLPFFLYLLSSCVPKPGQSPVNAGLKLLKIAMTVIVTFGVIWAPFLNDLESLMTVIHRLFPVARGVFEDKVANVWCTLNVFYKFKTTFSNQQMLRICTFATLSAVAPSSFDLFLRPNRKKFVLALINSSLAFFLFSFQVHEKTVLLAAVPVLLHFPHDPFVCFWFLCLSVFSMLPLLVKDELILATIALMIFYTVSFRASIEHLYRNSLNTRDGLGEYYRNLLHVLLDIEYKRASHSDLWRLVRDRVLKNKEALKNVLFHAVMATSLAGCLVLALALGALEPPERYPDLYPLLVSVYAGLHFVGFFVYFNVCQFRIPQEFDAVKVKSD